MLSVYRMDAQTLQARYRHALGVEPKLWKCPCHDPDCKAVVIYARGQDGRLYFQSNQTTQDPPGATVIVDNVEDFGVFLSSKILPRFDLGVYAQWLQQGLKEAILSA